MTAPAPTELQYPDQLQYTDRQYPIGPLVLPETLSPSARLAAIEELAAFPQQLTAAIEDLADSQLDTPYRDPIDGAPSWTIRQLVHHLADSHATAYIWMRLALTGGNLPEQWPTVFAYDPAAIAQLDSRPRPAISPKVSLQLLAALHQRWTATLRSVAEEEWRSRGYTHPETGPCPLEQALAMYDWHCRHHLTQILHCRQRHGWIEPQRASASAKTFPVWV